MGRYVDIDIIRQQKESAKVSLSFKLYFLNLSFTLKSSVTTKLNEDCTDVPLSPLQIILHSMHRYHPRFHIIQADDMFSVRWSVFQTFTFPETSFMAVTAYQNTKVSLLSRCDDHS